VVHPRLQLSRDPLGGGMRTRPVAITISSLVLAWSAIAGVANSAFRLGSGLAHEQVTGALAVPYAVSAGVAAWGLWRMRRIGVQAFRVWVVSCFATFAWLIVGRGMFHGWEAFLFMVFLAVMFFFWHRHLLRALHAAA
jgi:hypothetical protein